MEPQRKRPGGLQLGRILIDLTTLAHRNAPPSGIARTEDRLAVELHNLYPDGSSSSSGTRAISAFCR